MKSDMWNALVTIEQAEELINSIKISDLDKEVLRDLWICGLTFEEIIDKHSEFHMLSEVELLKLRLKIHKNEELAYRTWKNKK